MTRTALICAFVLPPSFACGADDEAMETSGTTEGTSDPTTAGSTSDGDTDSGGGDAIPADASESAIREFLAAETYTAWMAETAAPRPSSDTVSPHGRVRVWFNDVLIASQKAGKGGDTNPHDAWSMSVKEMFDDADVLVGHAVMFNAEEMGTPVWTYFCWGPDGRCSTGEPANTIDNPIHGQGFDVPCGSCHGGNIFTPFP